MMAYLDPGSMPQRLSHKGWVVQIAKVRFQIRFKHSEPFVAYISCNCIHCKFLPHENYGYWKLQGPCREKLHYLWKRAVSIAGKPSGNYRSYNYPGVFPQFLQPFSIDSAAFSCRDPAIPSPRSFHGVKICSVEVQIYIGLT